MKLKNTAYAMLVLSSGAFAELNSGAWTLTKDIALNGSLDSLNTVTTWEVKADLSQFIANNPLIENDFLKGDNLTNPYLAKEIIRLESVENAVRAFYLGSLVNESVFQGTWYSLTGDQGDFRLERVQPPLMTSCKAILDAGQSVGDGIYNVLPENTEEPLEVYCDMTWSGGGWTRVGHFNGVGSLGVFTNTPTQSTDPESYGWHQAYSLINGQNIRIHDEFASLPIANQTLSHNIQHAPTNLIVGNGNVHSGVYINTEFQGTCNGTNDGLAGTGNYQSDYAQLSITYTDQRLSGSLCYDYFHYGDSWGRRDSASGSAYNSANYPNKAWVGDVWVR